MKNTDLMQLPVWYPPNEIFYHPYQVQWLLERMDELKSGDYPNEPAIYRKFDFKLYFWYKQERSPYIGSNGNQFKSYGKHEVAGTICADLTARMDRIHTTITINSHVVPISGALLYDVYVYRKNLDYPLIIEASRMLEYISGWRNKEVEYNEWRR